MLVFLDGQFVPEDQAVVSVFDRGFLYGDGLFETMLVLNGTPFRWAQHLERFRQGADFLRLNVPFRPGALREYAGRLVCENRLPRAILRLSLSRGVGARGYSPRGANHPIVVMSLHPAPAFDSPTPPRWRLATASLRLRPKDPLARFKTANKLQQILTRAEAEAAGADEALLLNTDGHAVEATAANLFWIEHGVVCTPPVEAGILPGITRGVIFELCHGLGLPVREANLTREELLGTDGVFLSLSSFGIIEGLSLDGQALRQSPSVAQLRSAYLRLVASETG